MSTILNLFLNKVDGFVKSPFLAIF